MYDIPCVIFAGGKSSRMGEDKALLPFGGFDTLIQFQLHRLSKLFKNVYISCKEKSKFDFIKELDEANFIEDIKDVNIYAPTVGFLAAFETFGSDCFFAISVDTPFVGEDEIKKIIEADDLNPHADATIARSASGIHPICGIYHAVLKDSFYTMLKNNEHRLNYMLKNSNIIFVDFEEEKPFLNMNNPQDYKQAQLQIIK